MGLSEIAPGGSFAEEIVVKAEIFAPPAAGDFDGFAVEEARDEDVTENFRSYFYIYCYTYYRPWVVHTMLQTKKKAKGSKERAPEVFDFSL